MVFNGVIAMSVAHYSAEIWQQLRRIPPPEQISSGEMLELVCCFPLRQLGRFASWFWTYLCVIPPDSLYSYYDEDENDDRDRDHDYVNRGSSSSSSVGTYHNFYHLHLD